MPNLPIMAAITLLLLMADAGAATRQAGNGSIAAASGPLPKALSPASSATFSPPAPQVRRRDPLTEKEADQLREMALEPDKRMKLLVLYVRARMAAVEQLRADPKLSSERGAQIHDRLEDFVSIVDEIDRNLDDYESRKMDMRKGLKELIDADTEFQMKLRALKESAESAANSREASSYSFVLQDATEAVNSQLDTARMIMEDQEQRAKEEKEKEKERQKRQRKQ
ncbi:MAG TPA: hypothetical protein VG892_12245 [Terriglobales bacterium]|nr:hypothetical protein [Terriglobales bacterium]